jgi:ubiquinone/menaquinone biosynthesis C-methylase UbiE
MSKKRTLDDFSPAMNLGMKLFLMPEYYRFRRRFTQLMAVTGPERVLDFGCGIGLLEDLVGKRIRPPGLVLGVDIGANLLSSARQRFEQTPGVAFCRIGVDGRIPLASAAIDLVVTNLVSHLLDRSQKQHVYREFYRVLKPGGRALLADFGRPHSWYGWWLWMLSGQVWGRLMPYENNAADNYAGLIPGFLEDAGFGHVQIVDRFKGTIDCIECRKE